MDFITQLKTIIQEKHLLQHPFYQMWEKGTLPLAVMQKYAEQYYHLEKNFPIFLSTMHSGCEDFTVRQAITDNLYDEEHGTHNHRELWLQFGEQIGATRQNMQDSTALPETQQAVTTFTQASQQSWLAGTAALAAYESQIPEVAATKIEGLHKHYGITQAPPFFVVHGELDKEHAQTWWDLIEQHATTEAQQQEVIQAVQQGRDALWNFLTGICKAYLPETDCAC